MKFNYGTDILNSKGEKVGELLQVVIDPKTERVTHLIAKKSILPPEDKVIPIKLVMETTEDYIKLFDFEGDFDDLDTFVEVHFVRANKNERIPFFDKNGERVTPLLLYPRAGSLGMGFVPTVYYPDNVTTEFEKNIPSWAQNIAEGAKVLGLEGEHVGNVEEVITSSLSDKVTHFVISKGLLFKEEKLVPASWVKGYDAVQLKLVVDSEIIEHLPEYNR